MNNTNKNINNLIEINLEYTPQELLFLNLDKTMKEYLKLIIETIDNKEDIENLINNNKEVINLTLKDVEEYINTIKSNIKEDTKEETKDLINRYEEIYNKFKEDKFLLLSTIFALYFLKKEIKEERKKK